MVDEHDQVVQDHMSGGKRPFAEFAAEVRAKSDPIKLIYTGVESDFASSDKEDVFIDALAADGFYNGRYWSMSPDALIRTLKIRDADGHHMFWPDLRDWMPETLLGYPIEVNDDRPAIEPDSHSIALCCGDVDLVHIVFGLSGPAYMERA